MIPADLSRHIIDGHRITKMRCPRCLDLFPTCTALVAHCESGSRKCNIRKASDFGTFLDRLTGGFLGVDEQVRPEFEKNKTIQFTNPVTGITSRFTPPVASYLKYEVTKPVQWKPEPENLTIGGYKEDNRGLMK